MLNSSMSRGSATDMMVSLRMTTNAATDRIAITRNGLVGVVVPCDIAGPTFQQNSIDHVMMADGGVDSGPRQYFSLVGTYRWFRELKRTSRPQRQRPERRQRQRLRTNQTPG